VARRRVDIERGVAPLRRLNARVIQAASRVVNGLRSIGRSRLDDVDAILAETRRKLGEQ
jgi:hypothetical protein